jgi:hypothetical protein
MPLLSTPAEFSVKSQHTSTQELCQSFTESQVDLICIDTPQRCTTSARLTLQSLRMHQTKPMNDPTLPAQASHNTAHNAAVDSWTHAAQRFLS